MESFDFWFKYELPELKDYNLQLNNKQTREIYQIDDSNRCKLGEKERYWSNDVEFYKAINAVINENNDYLIALHNNYFEICKKRNVKFDILHPYFKIFYLDEIFAIKHIKVLDIVALLPFSSFITLALYRSIINMLNKYNDVYEIYVLNSLVPPNDLAGNKCDNEYIHKWRFNLVPAKLHVVDNKSFRDVLEKITEKYHFLNFAIDFTVKNMVVAIKYLNNILEVGGSFIFMIKTIFNRVIAEILSILTTIFKKIHIIKNTDNYKETMFVYCQGFKNVSDRIIAILNEIADVQNKDKFTSVITTSIKDQLAIIIKANNENLKLKCDYIQKIIYFTFNLNLNYDVIKHYNLLIYSKIVKEYDALNLPLFDIYDINKKFEDLDFGKKQLYVMKYNNFSNLSIRQSDIDKFNSYIEYVIYYSNTFKEYSEYSMFVKLTSELRISTKNKIYIKRATNLSVSQAYMKCLEILTDLDFNKRYKKVNAFHVCEAPGQFILAFGHYYDYYGLEYEWEAQSYNPSLGAKNHNVVGDTYGLIRKHKDKWLWGNGTGDITDIENIKYYINRNKKYNITTADCGIKLNNTLNTNDDEFFKVLMPLTLGMYIALTATLDIGGTTFYKIFLPSINDASVYLVMLLYKYFENIVFYKSVLNQHSSEYYIIAYNKKDHYNESEMNILYSMLKYYKDPNNNKMPKFEIEKNFYDRYIVILSKLLNSLIVNVGVLINLASYKNKAKAEFLYDKTITQMSKDWIKTYFKYKKVKTSSKKSTNKKTSSKKTVSKKISDKKVKISKDSNYVKVKKSTKDKVNIFLK